MFKVLKNTVEIAHDYLKNSVRPGSVVVDGTVGNGKDTVYLAELVGREGRVYGFDIQEQAIRAASDLIAVRGFSDTVILFKAGHENIADYVNEPVDAVVFNLGYLPGGDHNIVTKPDSTVKAVRGSLDILKPGGLICIVVYTGHPGGLDERQALEEFLRRLDKKQYCAGKLDFLNRDKAPYLILIEKSLRQEGRQ